MSFRYLDIESPCKCVYAGGYIVITLQDRTLKIYLGDVSSIVFSTDQVMVSGRLMAEIAQRKIPVVFCNDKHQPAAESLPLHGAHNNAMRVRQQIEWSAVSKKQLWKKIIQDKISLQAEVLDVCSRDERAAVLRTYAREVKSGDSTNREGAAARCYFPSIFGEGFTRDMTCVENSALDYGYAILCPQASREIVAQGYLTQLGIFHHGPENHWNLACDFMEPFRPFVDYVVLSSGMTQFDTSMKRYLCAMMTKEVGYKDGVFKMSSVLKYYIQDCFKVLERTLPAEEVEIYTLL